MNETDTAELPTGHPNKWNILAIMCTCLVLVVASVSSLNLAIPSIINDLEPSQKQTLWIVDSYALVFAGLLLPAGAIGDRYGRKKALLVGLVIFVLGALWASQSSNPTWLIIARGTTGIGAALTMPATLSILTAVFPRHERFKAVAIWSGFAGAGGAIGIIGGGLLLEKFWWGSVFLINVPIAMVAVLLIVTMVPSSRDEEQNPLDYVGGLLSIAGLGALVYAIIEGGEAGFSHGSTIAWFVAAAALLTGWIKYELSVQYPLLDPRFFKIRQFAMGSFTMSASFAVMFGMFFLLTQYLQFVQGYSPLGAGVRNLPFALTMIVVAPRSPTIAAKFGPRGAIVLGLIIQATGFAILSTLAPESSYIIVAIGIMMLAAGMGILMPPSTSAILTSLPQNKAGVGSAVNDTTREVGGALGIAVLGSLMASGYRSSLGPATDALPEPLADAARDSVGAAFQVASKLDPATAQALIAEAGQAFTDGMTLAFVVSSIFGLAAATLIWFTYPAGAAEEQPE